MMADLPLDQVRTLLAAVDEGTFEAAARALRITPSAVSQRIKALEQRTGRVLLVRSKPVRLTESGVAVIRFARQLASLERDAAAELGLPGADEAAVLSIAVNADSLATWFLTALARVPAETRVCYDLHREDQDYTDQLLRQGLVMAAVSSSPQPVQGCTVRKLGRMRYRAMATQSFVDRWFAGIPLRQALSSAPVVIFNRKDDLQDRFLRRLGSRSGSRTGSASGVGADSRVASGPRHHVPASEAFLEAVASGFGWGMLPDIQVAARGANDLVEIAPGRPVDVPLYWQQWKLGAPALTAVGDAVAQTAAEILG